jgi:predicted helicase
MTFNDILAEFRATANSEHDKGTKFEQLMQSYLLTDPKYRNSFETVWLWKDFPARKDFGGKDTGIDLVARAKSGDYWAIQCKCFQESSIIDKPAVDSFLSTSSRKFKDDKDQSVGFATRLWISTTDNWGINAEQAIQNQDPSVQRIGLSDLENAIVNWEAIYNGKVGEAAAVPKKQLREHQTTALTRTRDYFADENNTRGKLIMACGTGKTFTSLRIAEDLTKHKGLVLFLVPSIALLGQTLNEWAADAIHPIKAICVCSDAEISKKRKNNEDDNTSSTVDLALPASTKSAVIAQQLNELTSSPDMGMTVVFSTYQSIEAVAAAQAAWQKGKPDEGFGVFDLIICDEAHRTTGVADSKEDEAAFTKVHDADFIQAKRRIYMTATPKLYTDDNKSKAAQHSMLLCSMDDAKLYGEEMYRIGFGEAVQRELLCDYKVLILTVNELSLPPVIAEALKKGDDTIAMSDTAKLLGCIAALSKQLLNTPEYTEDPNPMRRAIAFCSTIESSKTITNKFNEISPLFLKDLGEDTRKKYVNVTSDHIDGSMSATTRSGKMHWIKANVPEENPCRMLTNVRCLSEGIDVPSLDAAIFLSPRNSQVDVVQSVGRVMRKSEGKKFGYIIIPIFVPANVEAEQALDKNEEYKTVWAVLNALKAHDDNFNAIINQIQFGEKNGKVLVGQGDTGTGRSMSDEQKKRVNQQLQFDFENLQTAIYAKMVQKVGDPTFWEKWAKDVAAIAERHISRIKTLIATEGEHQAAFNEFLKGLQQNINPSIDANEAIEMLGQHIVTKPVFEALFEGYSFVQNNPVSMAMQRIMDVLEKENLESEHETLQRFYHSVRSRVKDIKTGQGRQAIVIELYDKFFKTAFPRMVERLGIVYTPVELVDFILHSVNDLLQKEFGRRIADPNVHILDPFTGTGTFITRLLQSGLIDVDNLERKYHHELHANEIVLLAYYIAAINIENAYHDATPDPNDGIGTDKYFPFDGIVLTDTFQLGEKDAQLKIGHQEYLKANSARVNAQQKAPLRIIVGNPPYSVGQQSANDNAQNQTYPYLNKRVADTYAKYTDATNKNSLYDSYIKAFRWATDRLDPEHGGIVAFVTNGAWLDGNATDGFRKCLEQEFSAIYVFNLRGNQRTSGELSRKEGGKIFGSGSRTPVAITFLIKNPNKASTDKATIYYRDIGDYLKREEKLTIIRNTASILNPALGLDTLCPNEHGDWLGKRNDKFATYFALGDKDDKNNKNTVFLPIYNRGLETARDAWVYNFSNKSLSKNIEITIDFYNQERERFALAKKEKNNLDVNDFVSYDDTKISWSRAFHTDAKNGKVKKFNNSSFVVGLYRPFTKINAYFNREINNIVSGLDKMFPTPTYKNIVIIVPGIGNTKDFSVLISNKIPDLGLLSACQCFPLYYYEEKSEVQGDLFEQSTDKYERHDGISDYILGRAQASYGKQVTKEDVFYYVYGLLHSPDYCEAFATDLKKSLPRLPFVDSVEEFWAFVRSGRRLGDWHLRYEDFTDGAAALGVKVTMPSVHSDSLYTVEKMRFESKTNKSIIYYNSQIKIENIPAAAYYYQVNGKSAIEWVMERYAVTVHKESQIKNNPNDWATEQGKPRYILDLLLSVIAISVLSVEEIKKLPKMSF